MSDRSQKKASQGQGYQRPLTKREKYRMVAVALRSSDVFAEAHSRLTFEHFDEDRNYVLAVVWRAASSFFEEFGFLPNCADSLITEADWHQAEMPGYLDDDAWDKLQDFAADVYSQPDPSSAETTATMHRIGSFLGERTQLEVRAAVSGDFLPDLPELLQQKADELRDVRTLVKPTSLDLFPEGEDWLEDQEMERTATGISFFDHYMNGGDCPGEVMAFCGPYGSCKTTVAVMLAVQSVVGAQHRMLEQTGSSENAPVTYYVTYEEELRSLLRRTLSYHGRILMESLADPKNLSTAGNLKDYEKRWAARKAKAGGSGHQLSERERAERTRVVIGRNLSVIDFTGGTPEHRLAATDMANGIESVIRQDQKRRGSPGVARVIIDHASAAARLACDARGADASTQLRHMLGPFPLHLKQQIAIPMECSIWVMHQLSTSGVSNSVGVVPKMTDMAEARNFLEFVNFGFAVGTQSVDQLCVFVNLKHRRAEARPTRILKIDGRLARVNDVDNQFQLVNSRIVDNNEYRRVAEPGTSSDVNECANTLFRENRNIGV